MSTAAMQTNLCFDENDDVKRAIEAHNITCEKFAPKIQIKGCTIGFDADSGDVLVFFPLYYTYAFDKEALSRYFSDLKSNWENADFLVAEESELSANEYASIGFSSMFFKLTSFA